MKKLFTLLGAVLMASTSFGQKNWTSVIVNGDCEGTTPVYEAYEGSDFDYSSMTETTWNSFWVHEWPGDQSKQYRGTANIVEDPTNPSNHCIKVVIRSRAEGEAAGNLTKDYTGNEGTYGSWDCQFFIYATQPIPAGKEIRLQLRVKGEREAEDAFETQNHSLPGTYIDANAFGTQKYTNEWKTLKLDAFTVSQDQADKGFQCIAFNLCTDADANVIYLDDIKLQIRDTPEEGGDAGSWINFMRKGIYSDDYIGETEYGTKTDENGNKLKDENGKDIPAYVSTTNFMIQARDPETKQSYLVKAPVEEVPGESGVLAVHVPVRGYKIVEVADLDEDGQQQFDEDGNVKMKKLYYWNDGDSIGTSAPARYTCQFFISTLHKMVKGEKFRFKFSCKADKASSLGTQAHSMPTHFVGWNTFGDESTFPITTDWTTFQLGDFEGNDDSKKVIPSGANGCQTITFDCVPLEGDDNNFWFIFEECSFTEKYVTVGDRTLGTPEDLVLPVAAGDDEKKTQIDAAPMLTTFEVEDFSFLKEPKAGDGIKLYTLIEPDDPEDDPTESFGSVLGWSDGGFINDKGLVIDDENGINIYFDDESIDGTKVNLCVWNNPTANISFADGKTIATKLAVSLSGWYYVYNITLMSEETYAGIKDVEVAKKNNNVIYDLMGRKVSQPSKGLYIVNGKKYLIK